MGVYIPNVEMPRGCNSCPLVMEIDNTCSLTMGGCTKDKRPPHCTLIEIDDELIKKLQESAIVIKAVFNRLKKVVNNSDELKTELMGTNPNLTIFDECVESVEK